MEAPEEKKVGTEAASACPMMMPDCAVWPIDGLMRKGCTPPRYNEVEKVAKGFMYDVAVALINEGFMHVMFSNCTNPRDIDAVITRFQALMRDACSGRYLRDALVLYMTGVPVFLVEVTPRGNKAVKDLIGHIMNAVHAVDSKWAELGIGPWDRASRETEHHVSHERILAAVIRVEPKGFLCDLPRVVTCVAHEFANGYKDTMEKPPLSAECLDHFARGRRLAIANLSSSRIKKYARNLST